VFYMKLYVHSLVDKLKRSTLFWDFTQRRIVVSYRRFGTNHQSHIQGSDSPRRPLKMGTIGCHETSV